MRGDRTGAGERAELRFTGHRRPGDGSPAAAGEAQAAFVEQPMGSA